MKIDSIRSYRQAFTLTRPYKIAYKMHDSVENIILEITTDKGLLGLGAASPAFEVTGETQEACFEALHPDRLSWYIGKEIGEALSHQDSKPLLATTPAAAAALDIALHDLYAQSRGQPLVEVLGRHHSALPTSITLGIKNSTETLKEAAEYIARGFKILKVKLEGNLEEDITRLVKLREQYKSDILIRVDPNQSYGLEDLIKFNRATSTLNIEFIEQPMKASEWPLLDELPKKERDRIALDESLLTLQDAKKLLTPNPCCGIFNIKLMKCGGIKEALKIASLANKAAIHLMWGCMDESIISITAALHAAFACPATRYLDLDGSLDLADDIVSGGFILEEGMMRLLSVPGLGVEKK